MSERWRYAVAALAVLLVEVAIALWVRDRFVRPFGGDVLAVIGVYLAVRAATGWRVRTAVAVALGVALALELGQLFGLLDLLGLRGSPVARTVLGSGFDRRDLLAYAAGGLVVLMFERTRRRSNA